MKNLKVLTCGNLATLRDIDLVVIADSMPSLEDLDISFPVNDFGASAGNEILALRPSEKGVTDFGIEVLSSKLKGLRMIDLSGNKFLTDDAFSSFHELRQLGSNYTSRMFVGYSIRD